MNKPAYFTLLLLIIIILAFPIYGRGENNFYDDVLNSTHNIFPRGETPVSPHEVCLVCHTNEEVPDYNEPSVQTPPELAAIFEPVRQKGKENTKALWALSDSKNSYYPNRLLALSKEPSTSCLSCHDGVIGTDIHGLKQANGKFRDHPVNIQYPREANGKFVPAVPLPTELRYWSIPDQTASGITLPTGPISEYFSSQTSPLMTVRTAYGKVNCGSCHNPHSSKISAYLRQSPKSLCLVCHMR